jgi:hypothetical protein
VEPSTAANSKIAFIGSGNMAEAMIIDLIRTRIAHAKHFDKDAGPFRRPCGLTL